MSKLLSIPKRTVEDWDRGISNPPLWAEKLILEKLENWTKPKINNYSIRKYAEICKKFSHDTFDWENLDPRDKYIAYGKNWFASYLDDGISVEWAFHMNDDEIDKHAAEHLFELITEELSIALYDESYISEIETICQKYLDL